MCIYNYECDKCNSELSECLKDLIFTDDDLNFCCCEERDLDPVLDDMEF